MNMMGGMYAARAAKELIELIDQEIAATTSAETKAALERVKKRAHEIERAGDSGWY